MTERLVSTAFNLAAIVALSLTPALIALLFLDLKARGATGLVVALVFIAPFAIFRAATSMYALMLELGKKQ